MVALASNFHQWPIVFKVAYIEELVKEEVALVAQRKVGLDIAKLTEEGREGEVASVVEGGVTKHEDAIL